MEKEQLEKELLMEAEWAAKNVPDYAIPRPDANELNIIVSRIDEERKVKHI